MEKIIGQYKTRNCHVLHAERRTTRIPGVARIGTGRAVKIVFSGVNSHVCILSVQGLKGWKKLHFNQEELHWVNAY